MPKAQPKSPVGAAPINLSNITSIVTAKPSRKPPGNPEKIMADVADLTAIGRVIADLEDAEAVLDEQVRDAAKKLFLDEGCQLKRRPNNFKGCEIEIVDGTTLTHSVSCELRAYGSQLSEMARKLAKEHNIPVTEETLTHETYIINPVLAENMEVMQAVVDVLNAGMLKISAAMARAGLGQIDILQKQPGSTKTVTNDETVPAIFRLPREVAEIALPVFTTMSVGKGKHDSPPGEDNLERAFVRTERLISRPGFKARMHGMAEKRKAKKRA